MNVFSRLIDSVASLIDVDTVFIRSSPQWFNGSFPKSFLGILHYRVARFLLIHFVVAFAFEVSHQTTYVVLYLWVFPSFRKEYG